MTSPTESGSPVNGEVDRNEDKKEDSREKEKEKEREREREKEKAASKASTVEMAIVYIKSLQKELAETKEKLASIESKVTA
jgi:hypothetical protein